MHTKNERVKSQKPLATFSGLFVNKMVVYPYHIYVL